MGKRSFIQKRRRTTFDKERDLFIQLNKEKSNTDILKEQIMYSRNDETTILFDLDGTITDTEKFYQIAWREALNELGYETTQEMALALRSLGNPFLLQQMQEWFGDDFEMEDLAEVWRHCKAKMETLTASGIPLKPGALELLRWLKEKRIVTAIATSNDLKTAENSLMRAGIEEYFDHIISARMVKRGKPAPDIYQFACEKLHLPPEKVFAVEDSPNGVRSASAAGCKVIMVPDLTEPDEELKKQLYARVDTLAEIRNVICEDDNGRSILERM